MWKNNVQKDVSVFLLFWNNNLKSFSPPKSTRKTRLPLPNRRRQGGFWPAVSAMGGANEGSEHEYTFSRPPAASGLSDAIGVWPP